MKYNYFTWIQKNLKLIVEWGNVWTHPNVETLESWSEYEKE